MPLEKTFIQRLSAISLLLISIAFSINELILYIESILSVPKIFVLFIEPI